MEAIKAVRSKPWFASLAGVAVLTIAWCVWPSRAPQIGADPESVKAVDALFTALTARDPRLVDKCRDRLHSLHQQAKLSPDASHRLDTIIAGARDGSWENAAEKLYYFMQAQRPVEASTTAPAPAPRKAPERKLARRG